MTENPPSPKRHRRGTFALLSAFFILVISVVIIGLNNIPGIILSYLAAAVLIFTVTRTWRKIKRFLILLITSLAAIFLLSFLHELAYGFATTADEIAARQSPMLPFFHVVISLIVTFVCPVGLLAGMAGSVGLFIFRNKAGISRDA
jgi:hypothetical protein